MAWDTTTKIPCPYCDKEMLRGPLSTHIKWKHPDHAALGSAPAPTSDLPVSEADGDRELVAGLAVDSEKVDGASPFVGEQRPTDSTGETAPTAGKRGLFDRFKKAPKAEAPGPGRPQTKETRPGGGKGKAGRRKPAADLLGDVYGGLGRLIQPRPGWMATGRMVEFQGPIAGEMLDEAAAGSPVDRLLLQPAVKAQDRFALIAAVIGPPLIVHQIENHPERGAQLMPLLESSIRRSLPLMLPAMKKVMKRRKDEADAINEMMDLDPDFFPEGMAPLPGEDPVKFFVRQLFDGIVVPVRTEPTEGVPV